MADATQVAPLVFTATSAFSLAAVASMGVIATTASRKLLPNNATWQDRWTFIWLVRTMCWSFHNPDRFTLTAHRCRDDTKTPNPTIKPKPKHAHKKNTP